MYRLWPMLMLVGCLDPLVSDEVPPAGLFLDPSTPITSIPTVESDGRFAAQRSQFTTRVDYLQAYASGQKVWYWNVDGPITELIAPLYVVVAADGTRAPPIIDALPGEPGYSPWWRVIEVRATASYKGERLTSRLAVEAAVDAGLVEAPVATTIVLTGVVVRESVRVDVGGGVIAEPAVAFYKGRRVAWIEFSDTVERPVEQNILESAPVYMLQRIDESSPISERMANRDLNGDGVLNASNNIFARNVGEEGYTPQWVATLVRVERDVRSIDTSTRTPELTRESDIVIPPDQPRLPRALSVTSQGGLVNCPIQVTKGKL